MITVYLFLKILVFLTFHDKCLGLPIKDFQSSTETLTNAMMYLMKYGYMDHHHKSNKSAPLLSRDGLRDYVAKFQGFAGLPVTGELDRVTVKLMKQPRCGVKDDVGKNMGSSRSKRFALQGSRWKVNTLLYKISKYPTNTDMSRGEVDTEIHRALTVWSNVTKLSFEQRRAGPVHIDVRFEEGEHGDGDPFDGSGGTLAHAYFPVFGGDAHFDNSEHWTVQGDTGTNLLQTAAHEFGHSLGLSHSDQHGALMAPFYRGFQHMISLDSDDVTAVQALYGASEASDNEVREAPRSGKSLVGDNRLLCQSSSRIDSILSLEDGSTFVFQDEHCWRLTDDSVARGYPKKISKIWKGLPDKIDAAFTWRNGKTYFFSGSEYWRFSGLKPDRGYPKKIRTGFSGIPEDLDAAFVWSGNDKIYFFKGSKYWKFDPSARPPVEADYPKPVNNWIGIPDNVDGALQYDNGYTYFFKGSQYYRFDDMKFEVDDGDPPFPRSAGEWWFGCKQ